jgi:galactokinase
MNSTLQPGMNRFFENVIESYEERIHKIQTAFQSSEKITESSHTLFDSVHHALNDLKKERDSLNCRLCEALAKKGSLRKKDYYTLMSGILSLLESREQEAEQQFLLFLENQKQTAQLLKNSLLGLNDITSGESGEKIRQIRHQLTEVTRQQEENKQILKKTFTDFQNLHNKLMESLESMLKKGNDIAVQDIKSIRERFIHDMN